MLCQLYIYLRQFSQLFMYNVDKIHRAKMNYLKIKYILVRNTTCFCPILFLITILAFLIRRYHPYSESCLPETTFYFLPKCKGFIAQ